MQSEKIPSDMEEALRYKLLALLTLLTLADMAETVFNIKTALHC